MQDGDTTPPDEPDTGATGDEDTDDEDTGDEDTGDDEDTPLPAGAEGSALLRRELDQNLRAILQEEVAREMAARAADTEPEPGPPRPDPTRRSPIGPWNATCRPIGSGSPRRPSTSTGFPTSVPPR